MNLTSVKEFPLRHNPVRIRIVQAAIFWTLLISVQDAHAYLDPGTGSLVIQALIAGFVGASFYIITSWKKLKVFYHEKFGKKDQE
jgi:hypothetical protein